MKKESRRTHNTHTDVITILKDNNLKCTQGRIDILSLLTEQEEPMSVEQIISSLGHASPDRATVYRMLSQFVTIQLVKEIHLHDGVVRYEIQDRDSHHGCCHHVVCTDCGLVSHVESEQVEQAISSMVKNMHNFSIINSHALEFFGICRTCSKK